MAGAEPAARPAMQRARAARSRPPGCPARVLDSEAQVMWSKLVRLNALACTTSAYDKLLGEIRSTPQLRADLVGAIEEACAVGRAEGAEDVDPAERDRRARAAHDTLGSSMQRDIAAGPRARARRDPRLGAARGRAPRAALPDDRAAGRDDRRARRRACRADQCNL